MSCRVYFYRVQMPAAHFSEWIVCVPLMAYICITADPTHSFNNLDVLIITGHFISILFGYAAQIAPNELLCCLLLFIACIGALAGPGLLHLTNAEYRELHLNTVSGKWEGLYQRKLIVASRKRTLATVIFFLFPTFPSIYALRMMGVLDASQTFALFLMFSAFTKCCFAVVCMDAHLQVYHPSLVLLDAERIAKDSRLSFLRYISHEIRVPLNSIQLGLDILNCNYALIEEDLSTVGILREAAQNLTSSLSDVSVLLLIEEGKVTLERRTFVLKDMFASIYHRVEEASHSRGVSLQFEIDSKLPAAVRGDKYKLLRMLVHIVLNAIRFSPQGSLVRVTAALCSVRSLDLMDAWTDGGMSSCSRDHLVLFTISDSGCGFKDVTGTHCFTVMMAPMCAEDFSLLLCCMFQVTSSCLSPR